MAEISVSVAGPLNCSRSRDAIGFEEVAAFVRTRTPLLKDVNGRVEFAFASDGLRVF